MNEFLKSLLSLSTIIENKTKQNEYENVEQIRFEIGEYKFQLFCVYHSITITVWSGNNFNVFVFVFNKENKIGEAEIKEAEKFFNIVHLPPDLIIQELNKIGVKEL